MKDNIRNIKLFPELALFDTPAARKKAMKLALRGIYRTRGFWLWMACVVGVSAAIPMIFRRYVPLPPAMVGGIGGGLGGGLAGGAMLWFCRSSVQRSLRGQLVELGTPVCLHCGYDLRGQEEPRCPECGRPFDKRLLIPTPDKT
ncbi:MAG: hypothetical protein ACE5EX_08240 [Phycisphaerae bacterium]